MKREERLAKILLKYCGIKFVHAPNVLEIGLPGRLHPKFYFTEWTDITEPERPRGLGFNFFTYLEFNSYINEFEDILKKIPKYHNADELDLQLTLLGINSDEYLVSDEDHN